jgi:hypothetical protein
VTVVKPPVVSLGLRRKFGTSRKDKLNPFELGHRKVFYLVRDLEWWQWRETGDY